MHKANRAGPTPIKKGSIQQLEVKNITISLKGNICLALTFEQLELNSKFNSSGVKEAQKLRGTRLDPLYCSTTNNSLSYSNKNTYRCDMA